MDNRGKYLVINEILGWQKGLCYNLDLSEQGISVRQIDDYEVKSIIPLQPISASIGITDFYPGKCDVLYLLDGVKCLLSAFNVQSQTLLWVDKLEKLGAKPQQLQFTAGTFYLLDPGSPKQKITALAQINHQIRWIMGEKQDQWGGNAFTDFAPQAFAIGEQGYLYVLNVPGSALGEKSVLTIHPGGWILGKQIIDSQIDVEHACLAFRQGSLFLLDSSACSLFIYGPAANQVIKLKNANLPGSFSPRGLCVDSRGQIYIGDGRKHTRDQEDDRFIHKFSPSGEYMGIIQGYRGGVDKLLIDEDDQIYVYDQEHLQITMLKPGKRCLAVDHTSMPEGLFISKSFDSTLPETQWHRLILDANIPADTQLLVSYYCSDDKKLDSIMDLDIFLADQQIPLEDKLAAVENLKWMQLDPNPLDALFTGKMGRYLWLKIELAASYLQTPLLRRVCVEFPRISYLEHLPAIYQENEASRDFLERFLALYQSFFKEIEWQADNIARYFDIDAVSGTYLPWLASWLGIAEDDGWHEEKLRKLVKRAPQIYPKRGTRAGMEEIIEIYTGVRPIIIEHFYIQSVRDTSLQEVLFRLFGDDPCTFTILLNPEHMQSQNDIYTLRRIIDAEKPAHTSAHVQVLQPWIYLDQHSYLGVNSYLSKPQLRLDTGAIMPRDTVLGDVQEAGQVQRRSRLGMDTILT